MFGFDVDSQFRLRFRICYIRCRFRLLSFDFRCSVFDVHLRCSISMFDFDFEFLIVDIDFDFNSEFEEIVRCQFRYPFFLFWISRSAFDCDVRLSISMFGHRFGYRFRCRFGFRFRCSMSASISFLDLDFQAIFFGGRRGGVSVVNCPAGVFSISMSELRFRFRFSISFDLVCDFGIRFRFSIMEP